MLAELFYVILDKCCKFLRMKWNCSTKIGSLKIAVGSDVTSTGDTGPVFARRLFWRAQELVTDDEITIRA